MRRTALPLRQPPAGESEREVNVAGHWHVQLVLPPTALAGLVKALGSNDRLSVSLSVCLSARFFPSYLLNGLIFEFEFLHVYVT